MPILSFKTRPNKNEKSKSSKGYEHWATKHNLKTAASILIEIKNKGFNSIEELERGISRISIEKNELKQEFDKLSWEQKRIKEDVEAYQKSYEEIDIFLKQFPHLKDTVLEGVKKKSGKNLFKKLKEHSKDLGLKQERIARQHDSLMDEFTELKHLKNNMDDYIGREKTKKKKESVACLIKKYEVVDKEKNEKWKDENLDR